jgi:dephospho-CoA kinase
MQKLALTGGIATGKSHVARRMREAGVPVVDADVISHDIVAPGTPGLAAVVARFGQSILLPDGTLARARLGDIVFRDAAARRDLEAIVHPAVREAIDEFFGQLPANTPFAVADIPLLYETGRDGRFDKVIVVACSRDRQVERVMARDGLTRANAERRLASQWPIEDKVARADYVIRTDGSYDETDAQVAALLDRFRVDLGRAAT